MSITAMPDSAAHSHNRGGPPGPELHQDHVKGESAARYDRRGQRADVDTDGPSPSRKAEPTPEPSSSGTADRGPPAVPPAVLALPLIGRKAMGLRPPPR